MQSGSGTRVMDAKFGDFTTGSAEAKNFDARI
jgi:hypothetical protein